MKTILRPLETNYFLYGTAWKEDDTERCVTDALKAGFRGVDTANQRKHYHEVAVGQALKKAWSDGTLKRSDLFIQTKFTSLGGQDQRLPYAPEASVTEQVRQSFESSLKHLHTDYLDSYVLHGPTTSRGLAPADWEAWSAMEALQKSGKTRVIGVSNVSLEQLTLLTEKPTVKPAFVQNRCYARRQWDKPIRDFCQAHGIIYQGFSLLTANPHVFQSPAFQAITQRLECTPVQAVFAFCRQIGILPLTGTTNPDHMSEDLLSYKFHLTELEISALQTP
jgi:diketogulonate reductase-like aldo/keto reductase